MAYSDMNDFLRRFFRQKHINSMSPEALARLQDDYDKGVLTDHQKEWVDTYFNVVDGKLQKKPLPDPTAVNADNEPELSDSQALKLYVELTKTLSQMKGISHLYDTSKDKSASQFLTRWFEQEKLKDGKPAFQIPKASSETEESIKPFLELLGYGPNPLSEKDQKIADQLKQIIRENTTKYNDDGTTKQVFDDPYAVNDFLDKCKNGKYNEDEKVQTKLLSVASALKNYYLNHYDQAQGEEEGFEYLKALGGKMYQHLENLSSENAFNKIEISDENLKDFTKNKLSIILNTLYENQNVRSRFKEKDQSKIVIDQLEKHSENKLSWHDKSSDDYIRPKYEDQLTPLQQLEKWAGDTYSDTLKKYEELRGQHLFFGAHAKEICKAIDKEKVKPADGLKGLLEKKDAIKKRFSNKTLDEHFDWFTSTMEELTPEIPKAIEGCWKDAKQMKCVIEKIILKATGPKASGGDFEKAKTAMEIMTVMKYGMMTSKVMDAMRKEEFSMFSDGKLSWNKNEGIQFVTKAFDKTVKAAFLGVGYGITIAKNKIKMRNMEFSQENNNNGPLKGRINDIKQGSADEKQKAEEALQGNRDTLRDKKAIKRKITRETGGIRQIRRDIQDRENEMSGLKADYDLYHDNEQIKDSENTNLLQQEAELNDLNDRIAEKEKEIIEARIKYESETSYPKDMPENLVEERKKENYLAWENAQKDLDNLKEQKTAKETEITATKSKIAGAQGLMDAHKINYDRYTLLEGEKNNLDSKRQEFEAASAEITELNNTIAEKETALQTWDADHKNKVIELENYWNFLQSGKAKTWRLFTKNAQEKFDSQKPMLYQQYVNDYGLAA